jgi:hypothetical protein
MTLTLNLTEADMAALEKLYTPSFVQMLHALRSGEGDSINLLSDNPEGPPNNAVECCGEWTGWEDRRFNGETLEAAVSAAYQARHAAFLTSLVD